MMRSELLIFKGHDSATVVVSRVLLTAFDLRETNQGQRQRRSIEVRVVAFLESTSDAL